MLKRTTTLTTVPAEARLLWSVDEAAVVMGIGHSLLWELVMRRKIASIKIGRSRRIPTTALQAYIAEQLAEFGQGA